MAMKRSVLFILLVCVCAGCGGRLSGNAEKQPQTVAEPPATPANRAVQVAWTAASARYCAFGLNPQKLKGDYLAWERSQGVPPTTIQDLDKTYDKAFLTFYDKVKGVPGYCSKERIEKIRPEINRHLAGNYEPSKRGAIEIDKTPDPTSWPALQ